MLSRGSASLTIRRSRSESSFIVADFSANLPIKQSAQSRFVENNAIKRVEGSDGRTKCNAPKSDIFYFLAQLRNREGDRIERLRYPLYSKKGTLMSTCKNT